MKRPSLVPAFALSVALAAAAASAAPLGHAVLAKPSGDAVVLFQATPDVASITEQKLDAQAGLKLLETDAVQIVEQMRDKLKRAKSVSVNVVYERTGEVSPIYKTATFGGFEKLMTVKFSSSALKQMKRWDGDVRAGRLPQGVTVAVTGKLPGQ